MTPAEELAAAVKRSDARQVAAILERHPALHATLNDAMPGGQFGATPLIAAVQQRSVEMIDVLLRAGADINEKSHWWAGGFSVLDSAADKDDGLTELLIERGAVVNAHTASRLGRLDRLAELVAADPEAVHPRGGDGQTPLHVAPTVAIARFLLDHGADIDARDVDHESTPAQYLIRDHQDVVCYLVTRGCRTDILMAAALGDLALVRAHLDRDPASVRTTVSEQDFPKQHPHSGGTIYNWTLDRHSTAHLVARRFGHDEVFRLLMDRSPAELQLAVACELGDDTAVNALIESRPNLARELSDADRSRLAHAAQANNHDAVRLMLSAGWPVDARGQHGATALHWAAFHGNVQMVREILRYGPPLEATDADYSGTPLGWAMHGSTGSWHFRTGDYPAVMDALTQAGARPA